MERQRVDSSNISEVGHSGDTLEIVFKSGQPADGKSTVPRYSSGLRPQQRPFSSSIVRLRELLEFVNWTAVWQPGIPNFCLKVPATGLGGKARMENSTARQIKFIPRRHYEYRGTNRHRFQGAAIGDL